MVILFYLKSLNYVSIRLHLTAAWRDG